VSLADWTLLVAIVEALSWVEKELVVGLETVTAMLLFFKASWVVDGLRGGWWRQGENWAATEST